MKYPIKPVPKPRQTRSDKWKKRPAVMRYRAFADEVRLRGVVVPEHGAHIIFNLPMPKSWSAAKKASMNGEPHTGRPDLDNLLKSLLDAIYKDDCFVWDSRVTKLWAYDGSIEIKEIYLRGEE